ncbi:MAG: element excision factor XisH family protein [Leptolyngbyaceae cyanobacterium bins.59]|nr:element excision factor XisH family protein [Leptolyngbyaceae cyanobacterium bins.59]
MPAKDLYHDTVKTALIKDGWTITKDPLTLTIGTRPALVDLGANKLFAAEKDARKIAVEIKSFLSPSPMNDLEKAIGQVLLYSDILLEQEPDRILYLAIPIAAYRGIFSEEVGQLILKRRPEFKLLVFNPTLQEISQWIPLITGVAS